MTGTIKKLTDKGFGFISSDEVEKDVFFHSSALKDATFEDLREGDNVTFEVEETDRGLNALNVAKA
jgi:CspA family cold shock protein